MLSKWLSEETLWYLRAGHNVPLAWVPVVTYAQQLLEQRAIAGLRVPCAARNYSTWNNMVFRGDSWNFKGSHGFRVSRDFAGFRGISTHFAECIVISRHFHVIFLYRFTKFQWFSWDFTEFHSISRVSRYFHGIWWDFTEFHGISRIAAFLLY